MAFTPSVLEGRWALKRSIQRRGSGALGTMTGRAHFDRVESKLLDYDERVVHIVNERRITAHQRYRYVIEDHKISIFFGPPRAGKLFVALHPSTSMEAVHQCGEDRYLFRLEEMSAHSVQYTIYIEGPHKDAVITTTLFKD